MTVASAAGADVSRRAGVVQFCDVNPCMTMDGAMKRSHGFLTIAALASVGLCSIVYRSVRIGADVPTAGHPGPAMRAAGGPVTPEAVELAELRQEMARLRHQVSTQEQRLAAVDPAKLEASDSVARDPRTDPDMRAEQDRKYREYLASLDTAFRKESRDPQWSTTTSSVVQTALVADNDLRSLARGVECRSHTCRVELADDSSGKLDKILPMFAQQVSQSLPSVIANHGEDTSGAATMVLYMSR
jgi:hypothetical protein